VAKSFKARDLANNVELLLPSPYSEKRVSTTENPYKSAIETEPSSLHANNNRRL